MTEYLSCAETAKLVRGALKKAFPGIKFSVRSNVYAGGASIYVRWTDGPVKSAVQAVTAAYAGGGFDGMIDMAYSKMSWLMPDGSAAFGSSCGTSGSRGMYEPYSFEAPAPGARKVNFGSDFIFCNRDYSVPVYTAAVEKVCKEYGAEVPEIKLSGKEPYVDYNIKVPNAGDFSKDEYLANLVNRELAKEGAA